MYRENSLRILLLGVVISLISYGFLPNSVAWKKDSRGIYESDIRNITIDPRDDMVIYAATSKALYRSDNRGKNYRVILRPSGEQKGVNDIYISLDQPQVIYAATDAGLYESLNDARTWKRIYYSSDTESQQCYSVIRHNHEIYLGTQKGLFRKSKGETNWQKIKQGFDDRSIYQIAQDDLFLYFATGQMIFGINKETGKIRRLFSLGISEGVDEDDISDEELTIRQDQMIKFIQASLSPYAYVLIASSKGIYVSSDHGSKWQKIPTSNLTLDNLTSLLILENNGEDQKRCSKLSSECLRLLAGTTKGVFFLSNGKWMPVYKGMETNEINYLTKDTRETIYAATAKGIFYLSLEEALPSSNKLKNFNTAETPQTQNEPPQTKQPGGWFGFSYDPGINEVHQMAIDYAEVGQEKIKKWRRQARQKAWLPQMDIGVDGDRDWSSSDSIWGSYSGGGQHYIGPDDKTRGEDLGWDVSFSWDLADLVWSTDQTTIDSRSKLMVELREDILNEVTRLYFERRRIQMEMISSGSVDPQLKMDNEMRVAELTALIDALTGGNFSKRIEKQRGREAERQKRFH